LPPGANDRELQLTRVGRVRRRSAQPYQAERPAAHLNYRHEPLTSIAPSRAGRPQPSDLSSVHRFGGNTGGVPLYACESCGYTSAAFRPEAARLHRLEYPNCDGVMRIIFRSEERYRGEPYTPPSATPPPAPLTRPQEQVPVGKPDRTFAIRETVDHDQALRLTLLGDLDLITAEALGARLDDLKSAGRPTRLDLSQLAFIDSSGIQALLLAVTGARWTGWQLEVAPEVSPTVERAAQIVGISQVLWPPDPDPSQKAAPTRGRSASNEPARVRR
jgi:anti-anti-sigma factor